MKVNFITSLKADKETKKLLSGLADTLEKNGHKTSRDRLQENFEAKPAYNENELHAHHKKMMENIKHSDVMIAEISTKSSGLGYEIAVALNERKPILALFTGSAQENSSLSLRSNPSKLIRVKSYTPETLEKIVMEFIEEAKSQIDTKFILIISPEIDKYLNWAGDERRMHKAQIVRESIEGTMLADKEYQQFLKDQGLI